MDLVSRLRRYIDHIAMPVTQFADTCAIPRPTMSQLLGGRNKKVSNELIAKIHDAFPDLNVLWLMFGQGDMLVNGKSPLSEPQNRPEGYEMTPQGSVDKQIDEMILGLEDSPEISPDNFGDARMADPEPTTASSPDYDASRSAVHDEEPAPYGLPYSSQRKKASRIENLGRTPQAPDAPKRIVNIIVYYSDNSFEAFVPEQP